MIIPPDIFINSPLHPDDLWILENSEQSEKLLFQKDSYFNNINVVENETGRFLKFGDSYQAGTLNFHGYKGNLPYINYLLIACLLNPGIKKILFLGMGTGNCANNFIKLLPELQKIDIVEIDPLIPVIAEQYFGFKKNKKTNIHIQDARVFVRSCKEKYDLVILDIFSREGMPYRFITSEFLSEVNEILTPNGMIASNIFSSMNFNSSNNLIFKACIKTYKAVFKNIKIFPTLYGNMELYRKLLGLKHKLSDITNTIIFAEKDDFCISKKDLVEKSKKLQNSNNLPDIKKIDMYVRDLYKNEIDTENLLIFRDGFEEDPDFNLANLEKYLYINHKVNLWLDKINPVDDETELIN